MSRVKTRISLATIGNTYGVDTVSEMRNVDGSNAKQGDAWRGPETHHRLIHVSHGLEPENGAHIQAFLKPG